VSHVGGVLYFRELPWGLLYHASTFLAIRRPDLRAGDVETWPLLYFNNGADVCGRRWRPRSWVVLTMPSELITPEKVGFSLSRTLGMLSISEYTSLLQAEKTKQRMRTSIVAVACAAAGSGRAWDAVNEACAQAAASSRGTGPRWFAAKRSPCL